MTKFDQEKVQALVDEYVNLSTLAAYRYDWRKLGDTRHGVSVAVSFYDEKNSAMRQLVMSISYDIYEIVHVRESTNFG